VDKKYEKKKKKKKKKEQHFGVPKVLHCVLALPVKKEHIIFWF